LEKISFLADWRSFISVVFGLIMISQQLLEISNCKLHEPTGKPCGVGIAVLITFPYQLPILEMLFAIFV
jgi:hypothetical protein